MGKIFIADRPGKTGFIIRLVETSFGWVLETETERITETNGHEKKDLDRIKKVAREWFGRGIKWKKDK